MFIFLIFFQFFVYGKGKGNVAINKKSGSQTMSSTLVYTLFCFLLSVLVGLSPY